MKFAIRNARNPKCLWQHYFLSAESYRPSVIEEASTMMHKVHDKKSIILRYLKSNED